MLGCCRSRLTVEPLNHNKRRFFSELGHLDGHLAIQLSIMRKVDSPHPALPQGTFDVVPSELLRDRIDRFGVQFWPRFYRSAARQDCGIPEATTS